MNAALGEADRSSTITSRPSGDSAIIGRGDVQTVRWAVGSHTPEITKDDLLNYSQRKLAQLVAIESGWDYGTAEPLSPDVARLAQSVVQMLVWEDDLATPQFSPTVDGGVDIVWLVAGNELSVSANFDGLAFWACDSDGNDVIELTECSFNEDEKSFVSRVIAVVEQCRIFLSEISLKVSHRLAVM